MIPTESMPEAVQKLSGLLPSTYAMQAFFSLGYNQETIFAPWLSVSVLLVSGILAFLLANYLFNWDSRNETRPASPLLALLIVIPYVAAILYTTFM
jgi:ABC-type multidrug transport system permease subunit